MTGYTVHTGSNKKFTTGWDRVFSKSAAAKRTPAKRPQLVKAKPKTKK